MKQFNTCVRKGVKEILVPVYGFIRILNSFYYVFFTGDCKIFTIYASGLNRRGICSLLGLANVIGR